MLFWTPQDKEQTEYAGERLDRREGQPYAGDAEQRAQREQHGRDGNDAANERDDKAARGLSGGAEVGGRDDVDAGGEKAGEVDAQAGDRTGRERRVVLAVEHGGDGGGEHENKDVHQRRDDERGGDGPVQQTAAVGFGASADERLYAGGQAGEDGRLDEGKVRDDAVGRDGRVSGDAQQHEVDEQQRDARGKLGDERGQAGGADARQQMRPQAFTAQMKAARRPAQVAGEHEQADERRCAGRERRAEHAETARKDEYPVEHDVEQASGDHAGHRAAGFAVVADEGDHDIVRHEKGRKAQQQPQIDGRHIERFGVRAEQPRQGNDAERPREHEHQRDAQTEEQGVRECTVGLGGIALRAAERIMCRAAHADHQSETVHQIVGRDGNVERGKAERAGALGDEKGVRENVA